MPRRQTALLVSISMAALAALSYFSGVFQRRTPAPQPIVVLCAVSLKPIVESAAQAFQQQTGIPIQLQYGGSGTLLTQLQLATKRYHIFIPADQGTLETARQRQLIHQTWHLLDQHPILAVQRGNPLQLHTLDDLMRPGVRLALAHPETASISQVSRRLLGPRWPALAAHACVMKPNVMEITSDVALGACHAAIVWDSVIPLYPQLQAVPLAELSQHAEPASAATTTTASAAAESFCSYLNTYKP
jgi:molybdate transport system substrate-binding protein